MASRQTLLLERMTLAKAGAIVENLQINIFMTLVRDHVDLQAYIFDTYPELKRICYELASNFSKNCIQLLTRLDHDFQLIKEVLGSQGSSVVGAEVLASETHCGSNVVAKLVLEDGIEFGYKPRRISLEVATNDFLKHLGSLVENEKYTDWKLPKYIDKGEYGWCEWMSYSPVEKADDVSKFYTRSGFLIAFATALRITDLHCDNIVAHGASPVPVDLETCLSHVVEISINDRKLPSRMQWNSSCSLLLPNWAWKGNDMIGVDISGLGNCEPQYVSVPFYNIQNYGTDNEKLEKGGADLFPAQNNPVFNGKRQRPWVHVDAIVEGFEDGMRVLLANKFVVEEWVKEVSLLQSRFISRSTATYHYTILASLHPLLLKDTATRFDYLNKALATDDAGQREIISAECDACMALDVPRMVTTPWASEYEEAYYGGKAGYKSSEITTGVEGVNRWLADYDDNVKNFEHRIIRSSIASMQYLYTEGASLRGPVEADLLNDWIGDIVTDEVFLQGSEKAASVLASEFHKSKNDGVNWYGFKMSATASIEFGPLKEDIYSGLSGICLALTSHRDTYAKKLSKLKHSEQTAEVSIFTHQIAERIIDLLLDKETKLGGAYVGPISAIPCIARLLTIEDQELGKRFSNRCLEALQIKILNSQNKKIFECTDLMLGMSGAIAICTEMHESDRNTIWLELAEKIFEKLLTEARESEGYLMLPQDEAISHHASRGLTGLSHGAIGNSIGIANFARLAPSASCRRKATELAQNLLGWELKQFNDSNLNWPDYRKRIGENEAGEYTWAHGAPGIYLALHELANLDFPEAKKFITQFPFEKSLEHMLKRRQLVMNSTVSAGSLGTLLIARRIKPNMSPELYSKLLQWSRLSYFLDFERREMRLRDLDAMGLWVGVAGQALGYKEIGNGKKMLPLLPKDWSNMVI